LRALVGLFVALLYEFLRDKTAIFFTFVFPVLFTVIFGVLFTSFDKPTTFDVGIIDNDQSESSTAAIEALRLNPVLNVNETEAVMEMEALRSDDRAAVIEFMKGYETALRMNTKVTIRVFYEPRNQDARQIVIPAVTQSIDTADRMQTGSMPRIIVNPIATETVDLDPIDFFGPGIMAFSIMQIGVFGSINLVVRREKGILKRLGATTIGQATVLGSEVILRTFIASVQLVLQLAVLVFVFGLTILNVGPALALLLFGLLVFIGIGLVASSFAKTEEAVLPIVQSISLPMFLLSGVFFPIDIFPPVLQVISNALPLTFLSDAARQLLIEGPPRFDMWVNLTVLSAWLLVTWVVSIRLFKWE